VAKLQQLCRWQGLVCINFHLNPSLAPTTRTTTTNSPGTLTHATHCRSPGTARTVNYDSHFNTTGNGYLAVYGWMTNPLVEYYIIESLGTFDPTLYGPSLGTYEADGSEYRLARVLRYPLPSDPSNEVLNRVFAVRLNQRVAGTVDAGAHFEAWKGKGLKLGVEHLYQIVATEGYQSSGEAEVTVW
jgi:endo-1,4-beta-xylanase